MINGDMVVAQAIQGATPPTWRVLRAKASFFYQQIGLSLFLLLLGGGGFLLFISNPDQAWGYGISDSPSPGEFSFWRDFDLVIIGILVVGSVFWLVKNIFDLPHAKEQVLVLMPEGFVIHTDKIVAHPYAAMQTLKATINRGTATLAIQPKGGAKNVGVAIDGRFGNVKQIAQMIATARNQFAAAQVAAPSPQFPQPSVQPLQPPQPQA